MNGAKHIEPISATERVVYRLKRDGAAWCCISYLEEKYAGLLGREKWRQKNRYKRFFDGTSRPSDEDLESAFKELRYAALEGISPSQITLERVVPDRSED